MLMSKKKHSSKNNSKKANIHENPANKKQIHNFENIKEKQFEVKFLFYLNKTICVCVNEEKRMKLKHTV